MRFKKLLAVAAIGLSTLSVTGAAVAASHNKATPSSGTEETTSVDTDDVQEGDQTSPDGAEESEAADTDDVQEGDQTSPDGAGSESETEAAGESDGPGGHEDPAGDVENEFDGEEK